nr:Cof-type HAD-IIB family hydrolase [Maliibacterium massiliense]
MAYRFIAFDLDDTALHDDRTLSQRLKEAVARATAKGAMVTISSGRIFRSTKRYSDFLDLDTPVMNCQGATITSARTGEVLHNCPVPMDLAQEVIAFLRARDHYVQVNMPDRFIYDTPCKWSESYAQLNGFEGVRVQDLARDIREAPTKLLGMAEPEVTLARLEEARAHFVGRLEVSISKPTLLEFTHPSATKGNALAWIGERYGIGREEMIAVGDSYNDLPMIEYAGLGVAVDNARDVVKERADYIAPSNNNDGVAYVIEKFILGEE